MRQLEIAAFTDPLPAVGFGCASLGSRVSGTEGLRALGRAFDAGITWFDVAPSYGDGHAETILGRFVADRRGAVKVCTKVGLAAPAAGWKAVVRPLARSIVARVPALRPLATRARSVNKLPITPEGIATSVENSLRRLKVERIDMLLLHDPEPADVAHDDTAETLRRLIASGKVAAAGVGVMSDMEAIHSGADRGAPFSALQLPNNPLKPNAGLPWLQAWQEAGKLLVTHSALETYGALPALARLLATHPGAKRRLADAGYPGEARAAAADFLIDYAVATNSRGLCLFSAMTQRHLETLLRRVEAPREPAAMAALGASLSVLIEGARDD